MQYNTKIQSARRKYLDRSPLTDEESKLIEEELSGKDFRFFVSDDKSFILPDKYNADATYNLIGKKIRNTSKKLNPFARYISYAAAVFIVALLSTVAYNYLKQPETLHIMTSYGERKEVKLPDGSTVILNSMSSITYPEKMTGKTREVALEGEAFFDVTKNPEKTFIVKTKDIEIKVLGTKFNVEVYENGESVKTTLFEGAVSVGLHRAEAKKLNPGEQAILNKKTGSFEISELSNPEKEIAWRDNVLVFDNERFSDILQVLSREYNAVFEIENGDLKKLRMTAHFNSNESLDKVLNILGQSADFDYIKQANTYKIVTRK